MFFDKIHHGRPPGCCLRLIRAEDQDSCAHLEIIALLWGWFQAENEVDHGISWYYMYYVHVQMVIFIFKEMDRNGISEWLLSMDLDGFRGSPLFSHRPILVVLDDFTRKIRGNQELIPQYLGTMGLWDYWVRLPKEIGSTWDQMDMSKK